MYPIIATIFLTLTVGLMYASVFEWVLHRYVMHQPVGKFRYAFEAHALTHHKIFKSDETYHLRREEDKEKIRMAWWNGPVLVVVGMIPFYIGATVLALFGGTVEAWTVLGTGFVVSAGYYGAYEYLHWCMHLPKERRLEKSRLFKLLNGHHILHHRYWWMNLNVVLPLADWFFGTFLRRSPIKFRQVKGPSVPDVQPLAA